MVITSPPGARNVSGLTGKSCHTHPVTWDKGAASVGGTPVSAVMTGTQTSGLRRPGYEVATERMIQLIVGLLFQPGDRMPTENKLAPCFRPRSPTSSSTSPCGTRESRARTSITRPARGNKCPNASGRGTAKGTKIILWACDGQADQQWALR